MAAEEISYPLTGDFELAVNSLLFVAKNGCDVMHSMVGPYFDHLPKLVDLVVRNGKTGKELSEQAVTLSHSSAYALAYAPIQEYQLGCDGVKNQLTTILEEASFKLSDVNRAVRLASHAAPPEYRLDEDQLRPLNVQVRFVLAKRALEAGLQSTLTEFRIMTKDLPVTSEDYFKSYALYAQKISTLKGPKAPAKKLDLTLETYPGLKIYAPAPLM